MGLSLNALLGTKRVKRLVTLGQREQMDWLSLERQSKEAGNSVDREDKWKFRKKKI